MTETANALKTDNAKTLSGDRAGLHARVAVMKNVVTPLLQVIAEAHRAAKTETPPTPEEESETLSKLVDSTLALAAAAGGAINENREPMDGATRWALLSAATQNTAARFRATGQPMAAEEADVLIKAVFDTKDKFQSQSIAPGENVPNTLGMFRAKMLEALVPVVNAVAQYSFGRAEHLMLAQVSERILKTADQVTRGLAPPGCSAKDWRLLCWSVLQAAGFLYSDCHFAEADRLLYMDKEERDNYFREHDNIPPLTFVWQAFDQRMAMLATLITYLDVPAGAKLDEQGMGS